MFLLHMCKCKFKQAQVAKCLFIQPRCFARNYQHRQQEEVLDIRPLHSVSVWKVVHPVVTEVYGKYYRQCMSMEKGIGRSLGVCLKVDTMLRLHDAGEL